MREWRLRNSLILLLVATTLIEMLVVGVGILLWQLPQIAVRNRADAEFSANQLARQVEYFLGGVESRLQPVAKLLNEEARGQRLSAALGTIVGEGGVFDAAYVVRADGSIEAIAVPPALQENSPQHFRFDLTYNPLFESARRRGGTLWSDKYLSTVTGRHGIGVALVAGERILIGEVSSQSLLDTVHALGRTLPHPVLVVDRRGEWLADNNPQRTVIHDNFANHPAIKEALAGRPLPATVALDGKDTHPGYATSPHLQWTFLVFAPAGIDDPTYRGTVLLVAGGFLAALAIGALIAPLWAGRVSRPLLRLTEQTRRLARGDYSMSTAHRSPISEINQLGQDMQVMAAAIRLREKEIARSEERLRSILDAAIEVAIIATDNQGTITLFNHGAERMLGLPEADVVGKFNITAFLLADELRAGAEEFSRDVLPVRDDFDVLAALAERGSTGSREWTYVRRDGSHVRVMQTLNSIRTDTGGVAGHVCVAIDITDWRRVETEIKELNAQLEARVQQRTADLAQANQELGDALDNLKQAQTVLVRSEKLAALGGLVAGVAHELNTPIGNTLMAATTLRDQLGDFRAECSTGLRRAAFERFLQSVDTATQIAVRNLERSADLVAGFKQLAVDQASSQRRRFSLKPFVDEVQMVLQPMLKRTPYVIETDIQDGIELDSFPGPLGQALTNLISNAVAHGFEGRTHGTIRISAELDGDDSVRFVVSDNGKGIPGEDLERIFDPFFTTKRGQGGSGLGLHIVHNAITHTLGGTLEVTSSEGDGTAFSFVIPRVAEENAATG